MKSNVVDIRTKEVLFEPKPRNTPPNGLFINFEDLKLCFYDGSCQQYMAHTLGEYSRSINAPDSDLKVLMFMFDTKNSRKFLVENIKDKLDLMFSYHLHFE
jgi:hypothetical protein